MNNTTNRILGTTQCLGCGQRVDVIYPYSNSDVAIGLSDHEVAKAQRPSWARADEMVRCQHAGLTIWDIKLGWLPQSGYGSAGIEWTGKEKR